ncbi:MAG: hypothetical protein JXQ73_27840 [Phycisphaerae bacterium]|nr:hypothetical protein [Phycisphaerae bacterium]
MSTEAPIDGDLFCPRCQYNLRGLEGDRCPECGEVFDRTTLHVSRIPWVHRKQVGRFRAYWRTVWLVVFRTGEFCREFQRPVSYLAAEHFRWTTILHAQIALLLAYWPAMHFLFRRWAIAYGVLDAPTVSIGLFGLVQMSLFFCLIGLTGVPSWLLHPRHLPVDLQNRAVAMSLYACAPLAWMPAALAIVALGILHGSVTTQMGTLQVISWLPVGVTGTAAGLLLLAPCWVVLMRLATMRVPKSVRRGFDMGAFVPVLWGLVVLLTCLVIPAVVIYIVIFVASLS